MRRLALVIGLVLTPAAVVRADYWPQDDPRTGAMQDIVLLYLGEGRYSVEDLMPYVACLDKQQGGRPRDWFYDSFMFLMNSSARPDGGWAVYSKGQANKADWQRYVDTLFAPDANLPALDQALSRATETLGPLPRKVSVILMIPYMRGGEAFGSVDDSGNLDFNKPADAGRAAAWLVAETARRFAAGQYKNLTLWGYYWKMETVGQGDEAKVKAVAQVVHSHGFGLSHIPFYRASGLDKWRALGFDCMLLQPNYAFMVPDGYGPPDEDRLSEVAAICRRYDLGIEIESWDGAMTSPDDRAILTDYLNHGLPSWDGYMSALHAYYLQELLVRNLYRSNLPAANDLYHDL